MNVDSSTDPENFTAKDAKIAKSDQLSPIQNILRIEIFRAVHPSGSPEVV